MAIANLIKKRNGGVSAFCELCGKVYLMFAYEQRNGRRFCGRFCAAQGSPRKMQPPQGELNKSAKLTEAKVIEIRRRAKAGATYAGLGVEFGVSQNTVRLIVIRKKWAHVEDVENAQESYVRLSFSGRLAIECKNCLQVFETYPSDFKKGRKYCSQQCGFQGIAQERQEKFAERFWAKVERSGTCWQWLGSRDAQGYGVVRLVSPELRWTKAHRVAYELTYGKFIAELHVCHQCDNPQCVNPKHLFLGNAAINAQDRVDKNRQSKGEKHSKATAQKVPRGEKHWNNKLTDENVHTIRKQFADGAVTQKELGIKFGVHQSLISRIVLHKTRV